LEKEKKITLGELYGRERTEMSGWNKKTVEKSSKKCLMKRKRRKNE